MAASRVRTKENLVEAMKEQLAAIRSSANAYDKGDLWEAKRIAVAASILLHDKNKNSQSITGQLGIKGSMPFISSTPKPTPTPRGVILGPELFPQPRLLQFQMENGGPVRVIPRLENSTTRSVGFAEWWNEPIYEHGKISISRCCLIRTMRDQDGGGHVDPTIEEAYADFKDSIGRGVTTNGGGIVFSLDQTQDFTTIDQEGTPIPHGPLASVRQIGWEILKTFELQYVSDQLRAYGYEVLMS